MNEKDTYNKSIQTTSFDGIVDLLDKALQYDQ